MVMYFDEKGNEVAYLCKEILVQVVNDDTEAIKASAPFKKVKKK